MSRRLATLVVAGFALAACGEVTPPADPPSPSPATAEPGETVTSGEAPPPPSAPVLTAVAPPVSEHASPSGDSDQPGAGLADSGVPGFTWTVAQVTADDLPSSWREGCPVGPESLRAVTVGFHTMSGGTDTGVLVVHEDVVGPAERVFRRLYELGFPIRSIRPVDEFGGSDDASMAADNTSAFNCRNAVSNGPPSWSQHAYGRAIDVNPVENPYVLDGEVLPPEGRPYVDRDQAAPGLVQAGSRALRAFTDAGFTWGGVWSDPDYQHFQIG